MLKHCIGDTTLVFLFMDLIGDELIFFENGTRHTVCMFANAAGAGRIKSSAAARQDFTRAK